MDEVNKSCCLRNKSYLWLEKLREECYGTENNLFFFFKVVEWGKKRQLGPVHALFKPRRSALNEKTGRLSEPSSSSVLQSTGSTRGRGSSGSVVARLRGCGAPKALAEARRRRASPLVMPAGCAQGRRQSWRQGRAAARSSKAQGEEREGGPPLKGRCLPGVLRRRACARSPALWVERKLRSWAGLRTGGRRAWVSNGERGGALGAQPQ